MLRILCAVALASAAVAACSKCIPGDLAAPVHCTPLPDAGSSQCAVGQPCVAIPGTGVARDFRCVDRCSSGNCPAGFSCEAATVGQCTTVPNPDADGGKFGGGGPADSGCFTLFACTPTVCGG